MVRRRQSDKAIADLIARVQEGGWVVEEPRGRSNIYKAKCPCGDHLEHIHSTPSNPNYAKNKLNHMQTECWEEESS